MNPWIRRKQCERSAHLAAEWADEVGHDREWWKAEAVRTRTDWSSLLRQRIKVLDWVRAGRPALGEWLKSLHRQN